MTTAMRATRIGVLAIQGACRLHKTHLDALGVNYVEIVDSKGLEQIDGLILPGGESGVMLKLIEAASLGHSLYEFIRTKPTWGICAGAILMAKSVRSPSQYSFGVLDIAIERNAYGRQQESCEDRIDGFLVSFIRAPKIIEVGAQVVVKARREMSPIWVESGQAIATTFHPETSLEVPSPWHRRLVELAVVGRRKVEDC